MSRDSDTLITELVGNLQPVKPLKFSRGILSVFMSLAVSVPVTVLVFGIRQDLVAGRFNPIFVIAAGVFFVLGLASAMSVIVMAQPRVGNDHDGWRWAAVMAGLLPLAATGAMLGHSGETMNVASSEDGLVCVMMGSLLAVATYGILVWWLRRGAPTSPERAGLLAGIAAGSFGIFAFSFHCPSNDIVHIGVWHMMVVVIGALAGRFVTPSLIRW